MCLPLCHPQTLFGSLLIIPLLSEYSEARLLPWKNQLWKLQGGSHFWRLGESFKCLYKQCTGTGHRINTVPLGSGLLPMSVCKMQLPHCSLLRDGLKFVLPGANTGNVFLSISVELVIHCVFKECDNSAPCFDFFFCFWLLLATAVSTSLPSAHLLLLWIVLNIITGRHQTAKSATGRKKPSTTKETCFDYSRCENWWLLKCMKHYAQKIE